MTSTRLSNLARILSQDEHDHFKNLHHFLRSTPNRAALATVLSRIYGIHIQAESKKVEELLGELFLVFRDSEEDRFSHTHISWQPSVYVLQRKSIRDLRALCIRYGAQPGDLEELPRRKSHYIQTFLSVLERWKTARRKARVTWWRHMFRLPT